MMIKDLIIKNRSIRRFDESHKISTETLTSLIDLARLSASAKNAQSLRYIISNSEEKNEKIFKTLAWAGYLKEWDGPSKGERPSAYLVQLNDLNISNNYFCDDGIAAQSILLGAVEVDLGGCIIASVKKQELVKVLNIPSQYEVVQVIALGKPAEKVVIETLAETGDFKYWRDEQSVHHVPKRSLESLILNL